MNVLLLLSRVLSASVFLWHEPFWFTFNCITSATSIGKADSSSIRTRRMESARGPAASGGFGNGASVYVHGRPVRCLHHSRRFPRPAESTFSLNLLSTRSGCERLFLVAWNSAICPTQCRIRKKKTHAVLCNTRSLKIRLPRTLSPRSPLA